MEIPDSVRFKRARNTKGTEVKEQRGKNRGELEKRKKEIQKVRVIGGVPIIEKERKKVGERGGKREIT